MKRGRLWPFVGAGRWNGPILGGGCNPARTGAVLGGTFAPSTPRLPPVPVAAALFDRFVRAHQDRVYTFALHLTGDPDEAADVAQEAFIRLWQKGDGVADGGVRAWLLRAARNVAIDRFRARKAVPEPAGFWESRPDAGPSPSDVLEANAEAAQALAALATLREPFRCLVLLADVQGLAYAEVGEALGLPLTSVKVYLHRARRMLREAYLHRTRESA